MERVKWEYKILRVKNIAHGGVVGEARDVLNMHGEEGWELVSVDSLPHPWSSEWVQQASWTVLYLKRRKNA
jgi:hypothetical protein